MLFASEYPDRVRTLTLCETPLYLWVEEVGRDATATAQSRKFRLDSEMLRPVHEALESGERELAIERFLNFSLGDRGAFRPLLPEYFPVFKSKIPPQESERIAATRFRVSPARTSERSRNPTASASTAQSPAATRCVSPSGSSGTRMIRSRTRSRKHAI